MIAPMLSTTREEMAWAAGLFDGEGCVGLVRGSRSRPCQSIRVGITQVDRRVLDRFRADVGCGYIHGPTKRYGTSQPQFRYVAQHHPATQAIGAMLWQWLSPVKRAQFTRCLSTIVASMTPLCPHRDRRSRCVTCVRARGRTRQQGFRMRRYARALLTA
jgi:hypothetical protein